MTISYVAEHFIVSDSNAVQSVSLPTTIAYIKWMKETHTILARCADGKTRRCRVLNFNEETRLQDAMLLVDALRKAVKSKAQVQFIAAGSNSADVWFCGIQEV